MSAGKPRSLPHTECLAPGRCARFGRKVRAQGCCTIEQGLNTRKNLILSGQVLPLVMYLSIAPSRSGGRIQAR